MGNSWGYLKPSTKREDFFFLPPFFFPPSPPPEPPTTGVGPRVRGGTHRSVSGRGEGRCGAGMECGDCASAAAERLHLMRCARSCRSPRSPETRNQLVCTCVKTNPEPWQVPRGAWPFFFLFPHPEETHSVINTWGGFLTFAHLLDEVNGKKRPHLGCSSAPLPPCAERAARRAHPAKAAGGCGVPVSLGAAPALRGARSIGAVSAG